VGSRQWAVGSGKKAKGRGQRANKNAERVNSCSAFHLCIAFSFRLTT
jgi:hypothetical protein